MKEIWKDVKGYEGWYQVSNTGKIKNVQSNKILKCSYTDRNYLRATLCKNGEYKGFKVHRLVAIAFLPKPESSFEVNHKDGNKLNNNVNNLEWVSHEQNMKHGWKNGLIKLGKVGRKRKKVSQYINGKYIRYNDVYEASKKTGIAEHIIRYLAKVGIDCGIWQYRK